MFRSFCSKLIHSSANWINASAIGEIKILIRRRDNQKKFKPYFLHRIFFLPHMKASYFSLRCYSISYHHQTVIFFYYLEVGKFFIIQRRDQ